MRDGYVTRVRRWRGAAGDEEDVVHDAFVRAAAGASALRDVAHREEWFFRVLRTAYLDHRRRGDARRRMLGEVAVEAALAGPIAPDPPELRRACLRRGLLAIRREYRTALEACCQGCRTRRDGCGCGV